MELWDAYDLMRRRTGGTLVRDEAIPEGLCHLVVHIWYRNRKGELLVQRRALSRQLMPGVWACTGGSVTKGEDSIQGLIRESTEEMGIVPDIEKTAFVLSFMWEDGLTDVYLVPFDGEVSDLHLQEEEVMDAKWITPEELRSYIGREDKFWQSPYLDMLLGYLKDHPVQ